MNQRTPRPLDAEERALAALLPRPHGRSEPGAELDARILAAARAATVPAGAKPATPHRRRWIAPTALAASLMLAVGLAWQLRPPSSLRAPAPAVEAAAASADASSGEATVRAIMPPPPTADETHGAQPRPMATMPPPTEPTLPARTASAPVASPTIAEPGMPVVAAPPPAPPAPVFVEDSAAAMPAPQMAESVHAAAAAMAKSARTSDAARERTAAANAAAQARDESAKAADASTLDTITTASSENAEPEEPDEDIPPATADSPDVRDAWLRRIGELLKQGKADDAKASLAEFRLRYPDATLPPELRKLEH